MTISQSGGFSRLLFHWKASLWQCVWKELVVYLGMYYAIAALYFFGLRSQEHRDWFSKLVIYLDEATSSSIPIFFLLGQYVVTVVKRWWQQFENIGWPDNAMYYVSAYIRGKDDRMNRTRRWFLPVQWIQTMVMQLKDEGKLDQSQAHAILTSVHYYKDKFRRLFVMDWVTIPLVYTQVVTVATYGYFFLCLIGRQYLAEQQVSGDRRKHPVNIYFPIFTVLEFFFYMGWLKVAEKLMHPFGEQDDDFELNYILDRHLWIAYMIADELHGQLPQSAIDLVDPYAGREPILPHTKASYLIKERPPSSYHLKLPFQEMELMRHMSRKEAASLVQTPTAVAGMYASTLHEMDAEQNANELSESRPGDFSANQG